jgi:myo-inositol-1(or 4)-monophosphatase
VNLQEIQDHSVKAGRLAAGYLGENFGKSVEVSVKRDNSYVTRIDRESQAIILDYLHAQFPEIPFIAEEKENSAESSKDGYYFVVDPLDGTATFVSGIPFFCVSIALFQGSRPLTGVIIDPNHKEEFSSIAGSGSFLNGKKISVTGRTSMDELTLNVNHTKFDQPTYEKINRNILKKIRRFHKLGSLCLEVAYVAAGRLDGTINNDLSMWDIAAAGLIVEEAGGRWSLLDGSAPHFPVLDKMHICASNGKIHDKLLAAIRSD